MPRYFAIVPAAGVGSRFGAETPKQYCLLRGQPLLFHALSPLCRCPVIDRVFVVLAPGDSWWSSFEWSALGDKLMVVRAGGETRARTVINGLHAAETDVGDQDWILVHDAARPCLPPEVLQRLIDELAEDAVGGLLAIPVADTLKRADASARVAATEPRDGLWQAQTPQMFRLGLLRHALTQAPGVTDEAGAVEALGLRPRLIEGAVENFKVTYPADLALAERLLG